MNLPKYARYKTVEASFNKRYGNRWSASIGGALHLDAPTSRTASRRTRTSRAPRIARRGTSRRAAPTTRRTASASHRCCDISRASNYARTNTHFVPGRPHRVRRTAPSTMRADDANREDNIWVFDVRGEKTLTFTDRIRTRLFLDVVQHHQQPRVGDHQPRDRHGISETVRDPRPHHGEDRFQIPLVILLVPAVPAFHCSRVEFSALELRILGTLGARGCRARAGSPRDLEISASLMS